LSWAKEDVKKKEDISKYAGYKKGIYINDKSGYFSLKINARMQARYTMEALDQGNSEKRKIESNFSIPRARLKLKGHVISKRISYAFQTDFGKGGASLKDFYADFAFIKNKLHLKVGQFKKPFSRQQLTSSGKLELVDRAITDKAFGAGRDIGFELNNRYSKSPVFEWAAGMFNGTGEKAWFESKLHKNETTGELESVTGKFTNVPKIFNPLIIARIGFNIGKLKGYSEADLERGNTKFGMGASGIVNFDADNNNDGNIRGEIDFILKSHGFSASGAFYVSSIQKGLYFKDQTYDAVGFHVQTGYVIKGIIQPVIRYALYNPKEINNHSQTITGGLTAYFAKHNLKLQIDAGSLLTTTSEKTDNDIRVRTQLQLAF